MSQLAAAVHRKACRRRLAVRGATRIPGLLLWLLALGAARGVGAAGPAADDLFALSPAELAEISVVSASLAPQRLAQSPASVTVITAEQMRQTAARNLYDVLRQVPGLRVDLTNRGRPVVSVRGVRRDSSNQLLFLLDGHALNETHNGSATFLFELSALPLENIARIEVIRGPGSAVFGSNAFLGVVNIITRRPADIDGFESVFRVEVEDEGYIGSELNLLYGGTFENDRALALNVNYTDQDGPTIPVAADIAGRSGRADRSFKQLDIQAHGELGPFALKARITDQDRGESHGALFQLSPEDYFKFHGGFVELDGAFRPGAHTAVELRAFLDYLSGEAQISVLPRGTIPPGSPFAPFDATGRLGRLQLDASKAGVELRATDTHWRGHEITYGVLWEYQAQDNLKTLTNDIDVGRPVWPLRDISNSQNFGQDANRSLLAPYVEDIWTLTDSLTMTAGLRWDNYSDFGDSLNPRLGVTWRFRPRYSLRALYGTAFRAPDFRSLYLNSPLLDGNPDLNEERVRTVELGLAGNPFGGLFTRVTLFDNALKQLIDEPVGTGRLENVGSATSRGVELEARYAWMSGAYVSANYSYVNARLDGGRPVPGEPRNSGSAVAWAPLTGRLHAGLSLYWQDASPRAPGDPRADLAGYQVLDANLRYQLTQGVELGLAAYNLMDQDYAQPAPPATIPDDYRAPGRSFRVELRVAF